MTRNEKINKLANAIRDLRGGYNADTGIWFRLPNRKAFPRVVAWLERLNKNSEAARAAITGFKTYAEFREWIGKL